MHNMPTLARFHNNLNKPLRKLEFKETWLMSGSWRFALDLLAESEVKKIVRLMYPSGDELDDMTEDNYNATFTTEFTTDATEAEDYVLHGYS
ncbi:hypothetical protein OQA88_8257 [Cercophora sp. LCS_1]